MYISIFTLIDFKNTSQLSKLKGFLGNVQNQNFNTKYLQGFEIIILIKNNFENIEIQQIIKDPLLLGIPIKIIDIGENDKVSVKALKNQHNIFDIIAVCPVETVWHPDLWGSVVNSVFKRKKVRRLDKNTSYNINCYAVNSLMMKNFLSLKNEKQWSLISENPGCYKFPRLFLQIGHISNITTLDLVEFISNATPISKLEFQFNSSKTIQIKEIEITEKMVLFKDETPVLNEFKLIKSSDYIENKSEESTVKNISNWL